MPDSWVSVKLNLSLAGFNQERARGSQRLGKQSGKQYAGRQGLRDELTRLSFSPAGVQPEARPTQGREKLELAIKLRGSVITLDSIF